MVTHESPAAEKIALFRSLFRGREDVYARRFDNRKSGKSGYAPVCANEWVQGICNKPRIPCGECPHRAFLPLSDQVVGWHLSGMDDKRQPFVLGIYPLLLDESCLFLAVDFDKESWAADAVAFLQTCESFGLPAALERSRSGKGAHVWIFFSGAIPACTARKLGSFLLTETMERRPDIGLNSYDRLFPNQDTLPRGGFGNLIALPLQKAARSAGNSVFIDPGLAPYPDQWKYLSSLEKVDLREVEAMVLPAEKRGRILAVRTVFSGDDSEPWSAPPSRERKDPPIPGPLPERIDAVLADQIYLPKDALPPALQNRILRIAAFQNPVFYKAQAMRLSTWNIPRVIHCAENLPAHIALPRGCMDDIKRLFAAHGIRLDFRDERFGGVPLNTRFKGALRPEQEAAAKAMLEHETGVLAATTAFGKTVLAAWLIAARGVNTLVVVHRRQLLEQWIERLHAFLEIDPETIGRLGGGGKKLRGVIDVAIMQSLVRQGVVDDRVGDYGHLIVDECHHLSAQSFELVARRAKARFVTGLSATVTRKDGHHPIIFMQCGPVRHRVDARQQAATRPFTHTVHVRPTAFRDLPPASGTPEQSTPSLRDEFQRLYTALWQDPSRNSMILADVRAALKEGRHPLLLTERTEHLDLLAAELAEDGLEIVTLRGGMGRTSLRDAMLRVDSPASPDFPKGRLLIATGRFIGEGFDCTRLDTLFLTLPVSWRGTIAQYAGRLHRIHADKREVRVYDYADLNVRMFSNMFDRRCAGYESLGYTILLPGSALPGWPVEVPLPVEPEWKKNYAASIRRLVMDGVNVPLAGLFLEAAAPFPANATGIERARSSAEAFFYSRLETMPATAGKFQLNALLPIPFDSRGQMEADFLCAEARLVVELDGDQHLGDADAYRRDRRKDLLLQQHGYLVLRFLCGDVSSRLPEVLDCLLAVLSVRTRERKKFFSQTA